MSSSTSCLDNIQSQLHPITFHNRASTVVAKATEKHVALGYISAFAIGIINRIALTILHVGRALTGLIFWPPYEGRHGMAFSLRLVNFAKEFLAIIAFIPLGGVDIATNFKVVNAIRAGLNQDEAAESAVERIVVKKKVMEFYNISESE